MAALTGSLSPKSSAVMISRFSARTPPGSSIGRRRRQQAARHRTTKATLAYISRSGAAQVLAFDQSARRRHAIVGAAPVNRSPEKARHVDGESNDILQRNEPVVLSRQIEPPFDAEAQHHAREQRRDDDAAPPRAARASWRDEGERPGMGDDGAGIGDRIDALDRARDPF